jgi:hypothetical protein
MSHLKQQSIRVLFSLFHSCDFHLSFTLILFHMCLLFLSLPQYLTISYIYVLIFTPSHSLHLRSSNNSFHSASHYLSPSHILSTKQMCLAKQAHSTKVEFRSTICVCNNFRQLKVFQFRSSHQHPTTTPIIRYFVYIYTSAILRFGV